MLIIKLWQIPLDIESIFPYISDGIGILMNFYESIVLPYPNYPQELLFIDNYENKKIFQLFKTKSIIF